MMTMTMTVMVMVTVKTKVEYLHVDLVRGISADHVQDRQSAARVFVQPSVQPQDSAFGDYDGVACCNPGLDLSPSEYPITIHVW